MEKVYIAAAKRTPIGSFLGSLKDISAADLGAAVIKAVLEESKIPASDIDEVVMGHVLSAGQGQGAARQAAIRAGVPESVPASAVHMVCGSGMKAVMDAYTSIRAGENQVVLAGGMESMSQAPYLMPAKTRSGWKMGSMEMEDHLLRDGLTDPFNQYHMGMTAENIVEKYQISREEQDEFAFQSQQKAIQADDAGLFQEEIVPVEAATRKGIQVVEKDEYINRTTDLEKLSRLRPAFKKDGSVTAGNSSGINDGASAVLVVGESYLKKHGLEPLAEIVAVGQGGVDPALMGLGPVPAIRKVLEKAGMTLEQMDLLELNEAFAAQSLGVLHELAEEWGTDQETLLQKTNLNGGAIALGHPIGASGNRIIVTLLHLLKKHNPSYGLASLCIGGGMGTAVILRNPQAEN